MRLTIKPFKGIISFLGFGHWLCIHFPWNRHTLFSEKEGWVDPKIIYGVKIYHRKTTLG